MRPTKSKSGFSSTQFNKFFLSFQYTFTHSPHIQWAAVTVFSRHCCRTWGCHCEQDKVFAFRICILVEGGDNEQMSKWIYSTSDGDKSYKENIKLGKGVGSAYEDIALLCRWTKGSLQGVIFEQRYDCIEGVSLADIWERSIAGRERRKYKVNPQLEWP